MTDPAVTGQLLLGMNIKLNKLVLIGGGTVTTPKVCDSLLVRYGSTHNLVQSLGYSKVCTLVYLQQVYLFYQFMLTLCDYPVTAWSINKKEYGNEHESITKIKTW